MDKNKVKKEPPVVEELEVEEVFVEEVKNEKRKLKKYLIPGVSILVIGTALAIALPLALAPKNPNESTVTDPSLIGKFLTQEKMNKLAFEATTATISAVELETPLSLVKNKALTSVEKDEIKEVLPAVDLILTNKSTFQSTLVESTNPDYSFELKVSYLGVDDLPFSYTLFFDILETRVTDDEGEVEKEITYKGISTIDMTSYEFIAVMEEETEDHEYENELSMVLYENSSKTSYIKIEQSSETEGRAQEESFEYEIWEKGVLKKDFEITTEVNGNKSSIELELNNKEYDVETFVNNEKSYFKFTQVYDSTATVVFEKNVTKNTETGRNEVTYLETVN